jgi:peptide deformylase
MVLKIAKYGSRVLREKAKPVVMVTGELQKLADDMVETMHKAKGVGLAAPQVFRSDRLCVIDIPSGCENAEDEAFNAPVPMPLKMFNPSILAVEGSERDKEGCLSFPDVGGSITRAKQVTCAYTDEKGAMQTITVRGFLARAVQHEIDHLDGILYVDHMTAVERLAKAGRLKKLAKENGGVR